MLKISILAFLIFSFIENIAQQWSGPNDTYSPISRSGKIKVGYGPLHLDWTYENNWGGSSGKWAGYVGFNAYRFNNELKDHFFGENTYTDMGVFEGSNSGFRWLFRKTINNDSEELHFLPEMMRLTPNGHLGIGVPSPTSRLHFADARSNQTINVMGGRFLSNQAHGIYSVVDGSDSAIPTIYGLIGIANNYTAVEGTGVGVYGSAPNYNNSNQWAGYFNGNVKVTGIFQNSDERLKIEIKDISNSIDRLLKLKPKEYRFKANNSTFPAGKQFGLIGQELNEVFPELILKSKSIDPTLDSADKVDEHLLVNYIGLIPHLIKAVQEEHLQISELKNKIAFLEASLNSPPNFFNSEGFPKIVSVSPNPIYTEAIIEVYVPDFFNEFELVIYDQKANAVHRTRYPANTATLTLFLNLPKDIYLLTLTANNVTWDVKRIIVSN